MQESKYFFKGIPISQYCKDNNINVNTVRTRIWKKRNNKKYENYSDQEIVDMVIKACGSSIKYMYKGVTLRNYCVEHGICYSTINSRIDNLKSENPSLTNDELVVLAMEEFENKNFRFFYGGMPLKDYCKIHQEINYETIRSYINNEKEKNPELTDNELIEKYLKKEHKGRYKYYYLGIPLKKYCEENNLNYKNIISYMNRYRNSDNFKELSDDEFVEEIMEKYEPFQPKYVYKGITLREYCIQNNLSYYSVVSFVKRRLATGSPKTVDELIDEGIKTINRYGIIYYYNGEPLKDYANKNNLNISSIRCAILRRQLKSDKPLQEIINECVGSYQKFSIKYFYNGIPLITYCKNIGLNYNTVIQKYLDEYAENTNLSINDAIKQIVDNYLENPPVKTKYYFKDISLVKFCSIKGYPYFAIINRMKTLKRNADLNSEQIVEKAIEKYENRLLIEKTNDIFQKLDSNLINTTTDLEKVCNFLKVNLDNVNDLINMDFSYKQAISIIWYFADTKDYNDFKIITDKKLKDLFLLVDRLKVSEEKEIEQFELYDLIGLYKSELYDSRSEILIREHKYIYHVLYSLCREYCVEINKANFEDFESEIKLYLMIVINRTNSNIIGQILKYMDLTVKGSFRTYLKLYKLQNNNVSLYDSKYKNGDSDKNPMIDYITYDNNYNQKEDTSFSQDMMKSLSNLSASDLSFVILKYQENYSNEDLASYFNLTLDEIIQKEEEILSFLKNDENVKVMIKR